MFSFEKDCVSVVLTPETLKIAHLKVASPIPKLLNVVKRDLQNFPDEEIRKILHEAFSSVNIKKAKGICVIPSSLAITKNIEIPSVDPAEIKSIIDLQAGRHTPFSREEILMGYINIGVYQRNYTKVLLILVNRPAVKRQIDLLEEAGLKVEKVVFASEAKARFYGNILNLGQSDSPVGIIDIGKYMTDFHMIMKGTLMTGRNLPVGMEHLLKEGVLARDKFLQEITASLESYQTEDISKSPEMFVLVNDDAKVKELQPLLQEKLKSNVKNISYLDHITAPQPVMLKIVSEYMDESFLDVCAAVLASKDIQVDLTPEEITLRQSLEDKARQVVIAGGCGIVLLLLVCAFSFTKIYFRSQLLQKLTDEYGQRHKTVEELKRISTNTKFLKDFLTGRMIGLEVLTELYQKIPEEIYLKNVTLEDNGAIHIQGISESRSTAFALITVLEDSPLFKNAKMVSSNAQKDRGKDVSAFEISLRLESAKDEPETAEEGEAPKAPEAAPAEEKTK